MTDSQKQRTVYLTDEEWTTIQTAASLASLDEGATVSKNEMVRRMLISSNAYKRAQTWEEERRAAS